MLRATTSAQICPRLWHVERGPSSNQWLARTLACFEGTSEELLRTAHLLLDGVFVGGASASKLRQQVVEHRAQIWAHIKALRGHANDHRKHGVLARAFACGCPGRRWCVSRCRSCHLDTGGCWCVSRCRSCHLDTGGCCLSAGLGRAGSQEDIRGRRSAHQHHRDGEHTRCHGGKTKETQSKTRTRDRENLS